MRVVIIVGAHPNFVKVAPLLHEMKSKPGMVPLLVHTGQHQGRMYANLFDDLQIDPPIVNLGVDAASAPRQIGEIMLRVEPVLQRLEPDLVVVVGHVYSTVSAAMTAKWMGLPLAHVEAGLRCGDLSVPEEVNRILTDSVSDLLFVTEASALRNLRQEGVSPQNTFFVGNVMVDSLQLTRDRWTHSTVLERLGVGDSPYAVLTLHRASNVDSESDLARIVGALSGLADRMPVLFPVHPRTRPSLERVRGPIWLSEGAKAPSRGIVCLEPLRYVDFIALVSRARLVLTDSGGVQEETTALGVPCLTLRDNTERPVTVERGTNRVIGTDPAAIDDAVQAVLAQPADKSPPPPLWDGRAASRIVRILDAWHHGELPRGPSPLAETTQKAQTEAA